MAGWEPGPDAGSVNHEEKNTGSSAFCLSEGFELPDSISSRSLRSSQNLHRDAADFGNDLPAVFRSEAIRTCGCPGLPAAGGPISNSSDLCTSYRQ